MSASRRLLSSKPPAVCSFSSHRVFIVAVSLFAFTAASWTSKIPSAIRSANCPCSNASLCNPIVANPAKEIYGFTTHPSNLTNWDWGLLTSVALFWNISLLPDVVCTAHANNARVIYVIHPTLEDLNTSESRSQAINAAVDHVQTWFMDGVNVDFELEVNESSAYVDKLTTFVNDLRTAVKKVNPYGHVTADVAWSPNHIDGRWYNYTALASVSDFLFIMSYALRSQVWNGPCVAGANDAFVDMMAGVEAYLQLGIPKEKLVLGLPWYGRDYPCVHPTNLTVCPIIHVLWRGCNCTTAGGACTDVGIQRVYQQIRNGSTVTGELWDDATGSAFYDYLVDGVLHQVWFDNVKSLLPKYLFAKSQGLHGIGFWNLNHLDFAPNDARAAQLAADMWLAVHNFTAT